MNIKYLQEVIIPQRLQEIENRENACTHLPIYIVLDLIENIAFDHVEINYHSYNARGSVMGYFDAALDSEDRVFNESDSGMKEPSACTKFYSDRIKAICLTRKAAEEYMQYQKHNLNKPYIYVFNVGYRNIQMETLLEGK